MTQAPEKPYEVTRMTRTYRTSETVRVGPEVRIHVRRCARGRATLSIEAPEHVSIELVRDGPGVDSAPG